MCGIFGVIANQGSNIDLFHSVSMGLKALEYRGYDSWGTYFKFKWGNELGTDFHYRDNQTQIKPTNSTNLGVLGLGHTRWTTHGSNDIGNVQPIQTKHFVVLHNGTMENIDQYYEYGEGLSDTHKFAKYLQKLVDIGGLKPEAAFYTATEDLEGDNLIVAFYKGHKHVMAWRSPGSSKNLYVGFCNEFHVEDEGELDDFIPGFKAFSSDVNSLSALGIRECWPLWNEADEEDIQNIHNDDDAILAYRGMINSITVSHFENVPDEDYMQEEIKQQKYPYQPNHILRREGKTTPILVGCGSSYNAALFGRRVFERLVGKPALCEYSSEFHHSELYHTTDYEIVGISQSGETHDTLAILNDQSVCIVNSKDSVMARKCGKVIPLGVGPERAVAATKTFTASCLAVMEYALTWGPAHMLGEFQVLLRDSRLAGWFEHAIDQLSTNKGKLSQVKDRYLFLGSGYNYPIVREAALKMKEVAYIPSDGMPSAEMKHGPIALIDRDCLSVFLITEDNKQVWNNVEEIKSRDGDVLLLVRQDIYEDMSHNLQKDSIIIPYPVEGNYSEAILLPIVSLIGNVYCQQLAYNVAVSKGLNPNRPRNLAKTVTV